MADALTSDGPTTSVPTDAAVLTAGGLADRRGLPRHRPWRDRRDPRRHLRGRHRWTDRHASRRRSSTRTRSGSRTENGERIGAITFNGTMALITFGGLGMGLLAGLIWVIVGPWIPGRGLGRALVTALAAIALGTPSLIQRTNPDFIILGYDPLVVALLIALVGAVGFSIALVDGWLDGRLPRAVPGVGVSTTVYLIVTLMGLVLILPLGDRDPAGPARASGCDPRGLGAARGRRLHARVVGAPRQRPIVASPMADADRARRPSRRRGPRDRHEPPAHPRRGGDALVTRAGIATEHAVDGPVRDRDRRRRAGRQPPERRRSGPRLQPAWHQTTKRRKRDPVRFRARRR